MLSGCIGLPVGFIVLLALYVCCNYVVGKYGIDRLLS